MINDAHPTFRRNMLDRSYTFGGIRHPEIYFYYRLQILHIYVPCHFVTPVVQKKAAALATVLSQQSWDGEDVGHEGKKKISDIQYQLTLAF